VSVTVELLREAAKTMRERAEAATPGPWGVGNGNNVVRGVEQTGVGSYTCIQAVAEIDDDRCDWDRDEAVEVDPEDDAEHIAAFASPAVALAVAEWLELEARMVELRGNSAEGQTLHALRVAREYLGRES
jgi:hypothetical protein